MKIKPGNVIVGTLLLSASSIFVRMIGFLFRIYLSNNIGPEGMGLYSLIMSLYGLGATIATSGIATAVSKLVAEQLAFGNRANARRVLRRSLTLSLGISITVGAAIFILAEPISVYILKDTRTMLSLRMIAPGMPFLSVASCLRGYFIAERKMLNPASGQVIEQLLKMAFIIAVLPLALPKGIEYECALIVLGISLGEVVCFTYSLAGYMLHRRNNGDNARATLQGTTKSILGIAIPISVSSYIRSALRLVEDVLIVSGLRKFSGQQDVATGTYGMLRGMVMPLLTFPLSLLSAFVVTLTPEISRLGAQNNPRRMERAIGTVLQYTAIIGIFIVGLFVTFSYELGIVVYKDEQVGIMLRQMAFLSPFMCLEMVVVSILQGLGEQVSSLRYSVSDCLLRIVLVYFLIPGNGVNGFVIMVVASNLFTSLLNLYRLIKITKIKLKWREWFFQPALATLAAGQGCKALFNYKLLEALPMWQGLIIGLILMTVLYLAVLVGIGSLKRSDMNWIFSRLKFSSKQPKSEPELNM